MSQYDLSACDCLKLVELIDKVKLLDESDRVALGVSDGNEWDKLCLKLINEHGKLRSIEKESKFVSEQGGPWFEEFRGNTSLR